MGDDDLKITATGTFKFEPESLEEVTANMLGEEYTLPAVKHPNTDALTSLFAVVIKLNQRVQELEAAQMEDTDDE